MMMRKWFGLVGCLAIVLGASPAMASQWVAGNGKSCAAVCTGAGLGAVASGNHSSGKPFYVCRGSASAQDGVRPGWNLMPDWSNACFVPYGNKDTSVSTYDCLCEQKVEATKPAAPARPAPAPVQPTPAPAAPATVNGLNPYGAGACSQVSYVGTICTSPWTHLSNGPISCPQYTLPASGGMVPTGKYPALFKLIGTRFGGDGKTTFALPSLNLNIGGVARVYYCVVVEDVYLAE